MDITFRLKTFLLKKYRLILKKISLFLSILLTSHVAHAEMSSIIKNIDSELPKSNSEEVQPNITNSIHQNSPEPLEEGAMSGNPAFTELFPGTGALGRYLKFPDDWGVKLGGVTLSDTGNYLLVARNQALLRLIMLLYLRPPLIQKKLLVGEAENSAQAFFK